MRSELLFDEDDHRWIAIGRDPEKPESVVDTNEYVIVSRGVGMLLDPGGLEIFPRVLSEVCRYLPIQDLKVLFASHQDPDISSSLSMWLDLSPDLKVYSSWLWGSFLAHFFIGKTHEIVPIPDEGMKIAVGRSGREVVAVPAHFCHSSGNFSIFDPRSKILFSGDIGAALLPSHEATLVVEDFGRHVRHMKRFHERWMPSSRHLRAWVSRVRALEPKMICPQHGSIFQGENVTKLLDWLDSLEVGIVDAAR